MKFEYYDKESQIVDLISWHNAHSEFCVLDTETTDKNPRVAKLIDIQLSGYDPEHAVAFGAEFLPLLAELQPTQVYHNFKYDWKVMYRHGLDMRGKPVRDTMLMHHLLDENVPHKLDLILKDLWNADYKSQFWSKYDSYEAAPKDARLAYACGDIYWTARLYRHIRTALLGHVPDSLIEHTHRLALALFDTELEGIQVDLDFCTSMGSELKADIVQTEAELRALGGAHCDLIELEMWNKGLEKRKTPRGKANVPKPEFNFNSQKQVVGLLYDKLKLPRQINRKTKQPSTDAKALEALAPLHPLPSKMLHHSKITTMYGTFIEGVLLRAEGTTIYPRFNENGAKTGRISHSDPNMGNIPSRGDWVKIRGIFIPAPGNKLITADFGQIEVCVAAHYSQDKNLLRIIHEGASQHDITAEGMGIPRALAKTVNFSMQYGATRFKIMEILSCSEKDAELALAKYWETYAGLKRFIDWCHGELFAGRPIANPFGRLRRFPKSFKNHWERESAQRKVFSSLIQGTAGDMMSVAFYRTAETLKRNAWGRGWFTVHDEGLVEAREQFALQAQECLVSNMLAIGPEIRLTVPLKVQPSGPLDRWEK